jgi:hypothetical protein
MEYEDRDDEYGDEYGDEYDDGVSHPGHGGGFDDPDEHEGGGFDDLDDEDSDYD